MRSPFGRILILATCFACGMNASANDDVKAAILLAQIQVGSQQLALLANDAANGEVDAFLNLQGTRNSVEASLGYLKRGDPGAGFSGLAGRGQLNVDLLGVDAAWAPLNSDVTKILQRQQAILESTTAANHLSGGIAELSSHMDKVITTLVDGHATKRETTVASYQIHIADRMARRIPSVLKDGEDADKAALGLRRDAAFYGAVLKGLINGNPDLNLEAVDDAATRNMLQEVSKQWDGLAAELSDLLDAAPALQEARQAADSVRSKSQTLLAKSEPLQRHIGQ